MANLKTKKMASGAKQYTSVKAGRKGLGDMGTNINVMSVFKDKDNLSDADFKKKYKASKSKILSMIESANNDAGIEQIKEQYKNKQKQGFNKGGMAKKGYNKGGMCGASNPASRPVKKSK